MIRYLVLIFLHMCVAVGVVYAGNMTVCFSSEKICAEHVVNVIDQAQRTVYVHASNFSSLFVAKALERAKKRGIAINIILEKDNVLSGKKAIAFLRKQRISFQISMMLSVNLSNSLIVDDKTVVIGPAIFMTSNASKFVSTTLFVHNDPDIAMQYINHFLKYKVNTQSEEVFCKYSAQCRFNQAAGAAKQAVKEAWSGTKNFWRTNVNGHK